MRIFAWITLLLGVILLGIGGYEYFQIQQKEQAAHQEASALLENRLIETEDRQAFLDTFTPDQGEAVGLLSINAIDATLPIIAGVDYESLQRGVGHHPSTKLPGQSDQILLSGHRDTVFTRLGEVEIGDIITVDLPYGTFDYQMVDSTIVKADDTSIIRSSAPDEELVISTCYPFGYVGLAPDRYVLYAIPYEAGEN